MDSSQNNNKFIQTDYNSSQIGMADNAVLDDFYKAKNMYQTSKKRFKKYTIFFKLLIGLIIGLLVLTPSLYYLIPMILNYPDKTYGTSFQTELENTIYIQQVLLISFAIFALFAIIIFIKTRFLSKYNDVINNPEKHSEDEINFVKERLFNTPYSIFFLNIILPSITLTFIHACTIHQIGITTLKLFMLVISFITLYVVTMHIYINQLFKEILSSLPVTNLSKIRRTALAKRIMINIVPVFAASLLFMTLFGYTRVAIEKGNSSFEAYRHTLNYFCRDNENRFSNIDDLVAYLKADLELLNPADTIFVKTPSGEFIDTDKNVLKVSDFFKKYLAEMSSTNNGRVYEYYGVDSQAATGTIEVGNQTYLVGVYFNILSINVLNAFLISYFILIVIDLIILLLFSLDLKYDVTEISEKFKTIESQISDGSVSKISSTSNDEIGDLCTAYNAVSELTQDNQDKLIEKERLASLGQMIGGIAHNLKTPIFSISGGLEGLDDLIEEYDSSIDDPTVNNQDMHDIAKDMKEWTQKLKGYNEYMSDVITAVKGQAVTLSEDNIQDFNASETIKYIDILLKHELNNALVTLNIENNVSNNYIIHGNINSLVQVLNNIISNAIESYNGEPNKEINLTVNLDKSKGKIIFEVQDFGPGLPENVKNKLFKEMITTKGKDGTGLGLFMSYSNIKAHFNGDISFKTAKNEGTTFYVSIPCEKR